MFNKYLKNSLYAAALIGVATACEPEIERETPDYEQAHGDADFSVYVALGNSLTSGYADGALNRAGQENSYPAIIAERIEFVTPGFEFDQPLLPEGRINGTLVLQSINVGPPLTPVIVQETNGLSQAVVAQPVSGSFNNMGVPGAKVGDLTFAGYGSAQGNPYFARFASNPMATIVDDAVAQDPTFFTLWIGNNDVLGYATQGGEGTITEPAVFEDKYRAIINQLVASNANIEGALANIPSVSNIPYLRAVSWNRFNIDATQAAQINAGLQAQIDPVVRKKVIYGVIEVGARRKIIDGIVAEGARRKIIDGIVTEGARRTIITQVAPQVVYQQAYEGAFQKAKSAGATDEQADAIAKPAAEAYVQSPDGQAAIQALQTNLIENKEPAAVHAIVEQNLASDAVQAQIKEKAEAAYEDESVLGDEGVQVLNATMASAEVQAQIKENAEAAYEDESVLGDAGVQVLNATMASAEVQAQIQQNYEGALQLDAAGQLEQALGAEGVAAVEANITTQTTQLKAVGYYPTFAEGANGFVVDEPNSPTGIRQLNENDLVTLTVSAAPQSEFNPAAGDITIPGQYVLDEEEQENVAEAIAAYNEIISEIASENTFALVDMNGFFTQVVEGGISESGTLFTNAFITGNAFSLDGVHLTQKGYALVARRFIETINSYYNSNIPLPNTRTYPAVALP